MSLRRRLRTLCCCLILQAGTLLGVPMRPEQVQELMHSMNQPTLARTDPAASPDGDGSPPPQ